MPTDPSLHMQRIVQLIKVLFNQGTVHIHARPLLRDSLVIN